MTSSILILDDVEIALTVMKLFLQKAGYSNVITFDNPHNALSYIGNMGAPSFVISDYKMPVMNGLEFLEAVHSICRDVPAILVSGDAHGILTRTDKYIVIEKGCPDFFQKVIGTVNANLNKSQHSPILCSKTGNIAEKTTAG